MTFTLLLTSDGKKMGKTAGGAMWLDPEKVSPYNFYQYWRNVDDADVARMLKMVTFVDMDTIRTIETWDGAKLNEAKELLAYEVTKLVHGEEEAEMAKEAAKAVFSGGLSGDMPTVEIEKGDLGNLMDVMVKAGIAASRSECRRLITQGGLTVADKKVTDINAELTESDFTDGAVVVKKGKKNIYKLIIK